jgi:tRNA-(ms[2]io[6]A)-hydroxylase
LLRSEARHYQDYLALAQQVSKRISRHGFAISVSEAELITSPDPSFVFTAACRADLPESVISPAR